MMQVSGAIKLGGAETRKWMRNYLRQNAAALSTTKLPYFDYRVEKLYDTNYLNVPRLPLPEVEDTLRRYMETVQPLASPDEFKNTARLAEEFKTKYAPELHADLVQRTKQEGYPYSYIEEFWDDMYQAGRFEIMVGSNPFYLFPDEANPEPIDRAARLANSCLRWWQKVIDSKLEADMDRETPLCMFGYGLIFGATRVPGIGRDSLATNFKRKHVIVICNSHMFKLEVVDANGSAMGVESLKENLAAIKAKANALPRNENDVGILTGQERDYWAKLRGEIINSSTVNKKSLAAIDDCLFAICLDAENPRGTSAEALSDQLLYGFDGANRWFDKHNIIATADGSLGMNFDHTFGDGLTWNRMLTEAWADMNSKPSGFSPLPPANETFKGTFEKLDWELPESVLKEMPNARANAKKLTGDVDTYVFRFNDFGREHIKQMKVSPDAMCQMAFQLAYHKIHGKPAAVYESCAMKSYFHGRTETIRSCTSDSVAMIKAFEGGNKDEMRAALVKACKTHVEVAKGAKATLGPYQGVDRHLYAMKCVAQKRGIKVPFFEDPVFARSSTWVLSTSNVSAPFINLFGFGAVCGHGYGLGYLLQKNSVSINVTSYRSNAETSSERLGQAIREYFHKIDEISTNSRL